MDPALLEVLTQFGALGVASGFIGWLFVKAQHRLDTMVETFRGDVTAMEVRCDQRVSDLRTRYDQVVERLNSERDTLHLGLTQGMKENTESLKLVNEKLEQMETTIGGGLAEMRQHYAVLDAKRGER